MVLLTEKMVKYGGVLACVLGFFACYQMGEKRQTRAQTRILTRVTTSAARSEQCEKEIKGLKGEIKLHIDTQVKLAKAEADDLMTENEILLEENDELKEENYVLEDKIDDLRDELNEQDFVADEETDALFDLADLGNNTESLSKLIEKAEIEGEIKKGNLFNRLVDEIKVKRLASKQCRGRLQSIADSLKEITNEDSSQLVEEVFGEWDQFLRFTGAKDKVSLTKAITEAARVNAEKQAKNNEDGVVEWDDFYDKDKDFSGWTWDDDMMDEGDFAPKKKTEQTTTQWSF